MARKRYDVCVAEKTGDKTYWRKVGVVLQSDKGFSLKMEAIPIAWDGWAQLFEPKAPDEKRPAQTSRQDDFEAPPF